MSNRRDGFQWAAGYTGGRAVDISSVDMPLDRCDAIYSGGASTLVCVMADGSTITLVIPAGTLVPIRATQITRSGSTNANAVILFQ
jgi:hypothetical protein